MVMGLQEVMGSTPTTGYWMDIFHICVRKVLFVCLQRPNRNEKRRRGVALV